MYKFLAILLFVQLILSFKTMAGDTIYIDKSEFNILLDAYSTFYVDQSNTLDIRDVSKPSFQHNFKNIPNNYPAFGFTESSCWLRFTIKNNTSKATNLLVCFHNNLLEHLSFFKPDIKQGHYSETKVGILEPVENREIKHVKFIFRIQLRPYESNTYFAYTKNLSITNLSANVYSENEGENKMLSDMILIYFMMGLIFTLVIICAFLWVAGQDKKLFYYFFLFVTTFFTYASTTGIGGLFIWSHWWRMNQTLSIVFIVSTILAALQFAILFLELKKRFVFIFSICKVLQFSVLLFGIYRILVPSVIAFKLAAILNLVCFSSLFLVGFLGLFGRYRPAISYMLSIGIFFGLVSCFICFRLNLVKYSYLTEHGWDIAIALQPFLVAIAVLHHFKHLHKQNEKSFSKLLESEERYKTLSNLTYEGILIHDNGIIVDLNESLCRLLQYSREELIGMNAIEMFVRPSFHEYLQKNMEHDLAIPYEIEITKKDKSIITIEIESKFFYLHHKKLRVAAIRDITHWKKAERELRIAKEKAEASQSQLELITDNLPVYISRIDKDEKYVFANKTYQNLLAKKENESIVGKTIREVIGEEAYVKASPNIKQVLKGESTTYDNKLHQKNGKDIYVQVSYVPEIRDNTVSGFFILSNNITERKLMENALHASEEKFAKAFHNSPVLISISELATGRYIDVNEEALRVSGYTREEVIGNTAAKLGWISATDRALLVDQLQTNGRIVDLEMEFKGKGGGRIIGLVRGEHVSISGTNCLLTVTMDITHRKKNEKELLDFIKKIEINEKKYKDLYESMNDAFVQVDMKGNIIHLNSAFLEMLGYDADEIKQKTYFELTPEKWHEFESGIMTNEVMTNGYSKVYEKEYIKKDGTVFPVELRTFLINSREGIPEAMWAIVRDITERKIHELEQLRHNENLEILVEARTKQLQDEILERKKYENELRRRSNELEVFNKAMINREMRIIEMKKEVNELCARLGIDPVYDEFWDESKNLL